MSDTMAFLGLGRMGRPMAANLAAAGFTVRTWNRSRRTDQDIAGTLRVDSIADAAAEAGFAITMLADDRALEEVTLGPDGLLRALAPDAIHISMSTISPALADRLAREHLAAGRHFIAAPVFGRPDAAAARRLWIVPGGEADLLARAEPIFAALGQGTWPTATAHGAALTKLIGNFLLATTVEALAEAFALAERGGLEPMKLQEMLTGTLFGSPAVSGYGTRIATTEFQPAGFALRLALKDVGLALGAAASLDVPLPFAEIARDHLAAAEREGRGDWDWAGVGSVVRERSGLPPVRL